MYKILPEEERVLLNMSVIMDKYTYWKVICAWGVEGGGNYDHIPLAITDDEKGSFSNAMHEVKELFPQYPRLTTLIGNIRDASYGRQGQLLRQ